jgi:hypothetical protein
VSLQVTITRLRVEEDDYKDNSTEPHFKRTRAYGEAESSQKKLDFEVLLDIRGRLLSVGAPKGQQISKPEALPIGQAIVNEMGIFVARPIAHILVPAEESERAEWIVTDADHVNGLLHRLKERKTFTARAKPPMPRRLREITEHLLSAAIENMRQVNWTWNPSSNLSESHVPAIDLSTWEVNRERFTDWTEDREMREQFARLFELYRSYAHMWPMAIQAIPQRDRGAPDHAVVTIDRAAHIVGGAAVGHLRRAKDDIVRILPGLVESVATDQQKSLYDTAMRAQSDR